MAKRQSRQDRWNEAINLIEEGLSLLNELKEEYEEWKDNMPEGLESSPLGEKLDEVCDHQGYDDIETAKDELADLELPKGFGRD
jgi:hypothetical protein|tara:strand:- start:1481 stop:1732 length:252 start_codon:yes stop_codon:yes gene_type:complete